MSRRRIRPRLSVRRLSSGAWSIGLIIGGLALGAYLFDPQPAGLPEQAIVSRVIDGDTIELFGGQRVRYLGIDTPETRRRIGDRWMKDPEPFGEEATEANRRLVEGRQVRLEYDVQPRDRYGRLLAYVYVGDEMINARLLEDGFAQPLTIPPNVKYTDEFRARAQQARAASRGLWAVR